MSNAEQRYDRGMAACLLEHALAGVDQQDGQFGIRRAGRHVSGVLLVPRRVGDHEGPLGSRKEAVCDVDRDALFAFGLEAVEQQGKIDVVVGRAEAARIVAQRLDLVLEQARGIVDQPADEGRLAVVDRAAGKKAQFAAACERLGPARRRSLDRMHQK